MNYSEQLAADFVPTRLHAYQVAKINRLLAKELDGKTFNVTLDLGCGTGFYSQQLDRHTDGLLILSDVSNENLAVACRLHYGNRVFFKECDAAEFDYDGSSLELVHVCGLLHHIPGKLDECIAAFCKHLAAGSTVIIDEPNKFNPVNRVVMRLSKADPVGDERPLSAKRVAQVLSNHGLRVAWLKYHGFLDLVPAALFGDGRAARAVARLDSLIALTPLKFIFFRWRLVAYG